MSFSLRKHIPNWAVNTFWHLPKAIFANVYYGYPSRDLTVIGITGTSGKTTTAHLAYHLLHQAGIKVALISTIAAKIGSKTIDIGLHVTNPDPFALQKILKEIKDKGYTHVVLEVTSHGLDQHRAWGVSFDYGVLVNIAHEHLDYHKTIENYQQAKLKLIKNAKIAVLNQLDPSFKLAKAVAPGKIISFNYQTTLKPSETCKGLLGDFNRHNMAAAKSVAVDLGVKSSIINKAFKNFSGIPGRMEFFQLKPFTIIIDFAHKPDALESALKSIQNIKGKPGKIISVFGSAGLRDIQKRWLMGSISAKLSDVTILTAEDPRTEKVEDIIDQIVLGFNKVKKPRSKLLIEPDRQKAINRAISMAKSNDFVCLFGKSHEKSMCYGTTEKPWSEHLAVKKALKNIKKRS